MKDLKMAELRRALQLFAQDKAAAGADDSLLMEMASAFPAWAASRPYAKGEIITYGENADGETQLYRVAQAHSSQADWTPDKTAALYTAIGFTPDGVPIWTQPLGAHDAYAKGDKVSHEDKHWQSNIDANIWEPGVYGWTEVI